MTERSVVEWRAYDEDAKREIGGLGGWFNDGHRWSDFAESVPPEHMPYYEAVRRAVVEGEIREGGDWHQDRGCPVFDDGTVLQCSYRAWGDLMAAIWSTEEDRDYSYIYFYMSP